MDSSYEEKLESWIHKEKTGVNLLNTIGNLMYEKGIELVFYRKKLLEIGVSELLNYFSYSKNVIGRENNIEIALSISNKIHEMNLPPSKIDIGLLTSEFIELNNPQISYQDFLEDKLLHIIKSNNSKNKAKDVILYGFGRIGRLVARELIIQAGKGQQLRLKAIVVRNLNKSQIIKRADLFKNDSVHGSFKGVVELDLENESIIVNGQKIKFINGQEPEKIDYTRYNINDSLLIDNTGVYNDRIKLSKHLKSAGVSKVLLTAPAAGVPNIVYGVNSKDLEVDNENIFSAASCTTNCIAPILKVIEDKFNIYSGHLETVHSYTNDQNLLDNMHKKPRRGRSAAINMVITSTGAGKAVTKVIPSLQGKLTANAVRVPTPNVSLAILNLKLSNSTSIDEINENIRYAALNGNLVNQINYQIEPDLVSSDIIGNTCCAVFDSNATIVSENGTEAVLYTWYDNEFGYSKQVIRLAKQIAKVRRLTYY
tara:strand:+ start:29411 stop:30856 length:1446 start_codon:yes stop_codon:yes gene_type:complete